MKELSIEEKEKHYDEALERAKVKLTNEVAEEIFPELKESEDERIKNEIINFIKDNTLTYTNRGSEMQMRWIAWLEKKGEKDVRQKFLEDLLVADDIHQMSVNDAMVKEAKNKAIEALSKLGISKLLGIEKQGEQKLIMIQWQGNNLKEVIDFTGKDKNFEKWFKSFEEYEQYVQMHNGIFKLFNEDGSHYEIPVGAWIVKTPDGYNVPSKAKYIQKSADKVEPKFKVGDWVVYNRNDYSREIIQVYDIRDGRYYFTDNVHFSWSVKECDEKAHLWTIKDAKDGDVLVYGERKRPFIFKGLIDKSHPESPVAYCGIDTLDDFIIVSGKSWWTGEEVYPATKEQRKLLFQEMEEAGWEWDAYKKELKLLENRFD